MTKLSIQTIKNAIGYVEIVMGMVCLAGSLWGRSLKYFDPKTAHDMVGADTLTAIYGLLTAGCFIASGLLLRQSGLRSWLGQLLSVYAVFITVNPD